MIDQQRLLEAFQKHHGRKATFLGRAPGRVNLIGEHTDYNGGFVFPSAINREVGIALAPRDDGRIRLYSLDFDQSDEIQDATGGPIAKRPAGWANYIVAVVEQLRQRQTPIHGFDAAVTGDVPAGSGLSSSAALEMAVGIGLLALWGASLAKKDLALLGQAAEHSQYVGVKCGIMDQFISAMGEADHALLIDCHSLESHAVPLPASDASILIVDSMVKRGLVDSEYNRRREECAEGLAALSRLEGREFETLRHAGLETFEAHASELPETVRRRLRHVVTENERTLAMEQALQRGDLFDAGQLLIESHESLRDDYEVSCPELDLLADLLARMDGVYGARMTGAGFGGCVVALVAPAAVESAARDIARQYEKKTGKRPGAFVTPPCGGARASSIQEMES